MFYITQKDKCYKIVFINYKVGYLDTDALQNIFNLMLYIFKLMETIEFRNLQLM